MKKNSAVAFILLFLSTLLLNGCLKEKTEQKVSPPPPPKVTVATPEIQDVINYSYFTGYTEAIENIEIRARVEGYLLEYAFIPGSLVKKGDLLFVIDPEPFEAEVARARAVLETRQAEEKLASATLKRKESAYQQKAVSEIAVLEAQAQFSKARAQVKEAEAQLVSSELQLSYTRIYAPTNGRIGRTMVDNGNLVGAGGDKTLLTTLTNYNPVYVYFNMDERTLMQFKSYFRDHDIDIRNSPVAIDLALEGDSDYPYSGTSDYVANEVDQGTGTILVRAKFNNTDLFIIPGLFAKIRIPVSRSKDALLVPETALSSDQRGRFLLAAAPDGTVRYMPVEAGQLIEGKRVIKKGISRDDNIIVNGIQRARPGSKVTPSPAQTIQ